MGVVLFSILLLNVCDGGQRERVAEFVTQWEPSLAVLLELNGWSETDLREAAQRWGHEFSFLLETNVRGGTRYKIGITAAHPFEAEPLVEELWHGAVVATFRTMGTAARGPWVVVATHLHPHASSARADEVKRLLARIPSGDNVLLLGDLNTLATVDEPVYSSSLEDIRRNLRLRAKFLDEVGELSLEPYELLTSRFVDVYPGTIVSEADLSPGTARDECAADGFRPTVPTTANQDANHAVPLRLDYVLEDSRDVTVEAYVIENSDTHRLSDHFPILAVVSS